MSDLDVFRTALEYRRSRLPPDVTAFRWSEGDASSIVVDLFGDVAVLNLYSVLTPAHEAQLANVLAQLASVRAVYLKRRPEEAHSASTKQAAYVAPTQPLVVTPGAPPGTREWRAVVRVLRSRGDGFRSGFSSIV